MPAIAGYQTVKPQVEESTQDDDFEQDDGATARAEAEVKKTLEQAYDHHDPDDDDEPQRREAPRRGRSQAREQGEDEDDTPADDVSDDDAGEGESEEPESDESDIDEGLIARANAVGITREDAMAFQSSDALRRVLVLAERTNSAVARGDENAAAKAAKEAKKVLKRLSLDKEKFAPDYIEAIEQLQSNFEEALEQMTKDAVAPIVDYLRTQQSEREIDDFDTALREYARDNDLVDKIGKAPGRRLAQDSSQFKLRDKIWQHYNAIQKGYQANLGKKMPGFDEMLEMAIARADSKIDKKRTRQRVDNAVRDMDGRFVTRPTAHNSARSRNNPQQNAERAVRNILQRGGGDTD